MINREKVWRVLPHIIGVLLIAIMPMFLFDESDERIRTWTYRYYYQLFFLIIAFYGNYLFIVPQFFLKNKRIRFFLILIMFAVSLTWISQSISKKLDIYKPPRREMNTTNEVNEITEEKRILGLHPRIMDDLLFLVLVFGFSTGMSILQKQRKDKEKQQKLEKANVENELAFLKNQINPHFFFNSLNNIYALIDIDGTKAQQGIEKLSGLMRYLIYESNSPYVPVSKEFEFTRNYIELMRQRLTKKVKLDVDISDENSGANIPPLLFISFIENAFKHGISYRSDSFIEIKLHTTEDTVHFSCKNSIPAAQDKQTNNQGGVGITNIRKRLNILYGNEERLIINEDKNEYFVTMKIPYEVKS